MALFRPKTLEKNIIIGVAGTAHGLGVTHLCIALANYSASKKRKKTACLELQNTTAFKELEENGIPYFLPAAKSAHHFFQIYDVDYYPTVSKEQIPILKNAGYEVLILDFGLLTPDSLDEFYRCDKKLLLGSPACWRIKEIEMFFSSYPQIKNLESLFLMISYGTKTTILRIGKKLSIPYRQLRSVPFLTDPFHIKKEQFSFFEDLL